MEITSNSTSETKNLAEKLAKSLKPGDIVLLYGDLGSGKTTFVASLVEFLGFSNRVQSPTFVVARRYDKCTNPNATIKKVHHLDLYRLQSAEEAFDIGINEMLEEPGSVTVIEWPEIIKDKIKEKYMELKFEYVDENKRKIHVQNIH